MNIDSAKYKAIARWANGIYNEQLGEALRILCRLRGWSDKDASDHTGLPYKTVKNTFAGNFGHDSETVQTILKKLALPSAQSAIEQAEDRALEVEYCRHFGEIVDAYRKNKQLATSALGQVLWQVPREEMRSHYRIELIASRYRSMANCEFTLSLDKCSQFLERLKRHPDHHIRDIHHLIQEAGLEEKYPNPVTIGQNFVRTLQAQRAREESAAQKDR